ncbi:MAG: alternate-type signal peptide domain-containing protein [Actinomycetota bacterium]
MTVDSARIRERAPKRSRTSAVLAIAAGAVLLLGGGTTLAFWSSSITVPAGTVNSGDLNLEASGTPEWTLQGVLDATPTTVADPTAVLIVPGDVLTMTQDATITLQGDTIEAELVVSEGTLPTGLDATVTTTGADAENLTSADDGATLTVTVEIEFDPATADRDLVNTPFDLSDVSLVLTQKSA